MALINSATLNALRTTFSKKFEEGKSSAEPQYKQVATIVPSSSKSNTYGWLGQWPGMREWIGDRILNSMKEYSYAIINKDWESTISVDRNDISDDSVGTYSTLFVEQGRASEAYPDELVFPMFELGFSTLCYDGQYFFDTDHPVNSKVDGTGTNTSVSNVIVDEDYTGKSWFLIDISRGLLPLIFQERQKPVFTAMDNPNDEQVFMKKLFRYGTDARSNAGYGFWQMAVGVKAELNYDNLWEAIQMMGDFKADGGRPLALGKKVMVVIPKSMEKQALRLKNRENIDDGSGVTVSNELKDRFSALIADYL